MFYTMSVLANSGKNDKGETMKETSEETIQEFKDALSCIVDLLEAQHKDMKSLKKLLKKAMTEHGSFRTTEVYDNEQH